MQLKYTLLVFYTLTLYFIPKAFSINTPSSTEISNTTYLTNNPDILNIRANEYLKKGNITQAIQLLNEAAEQDDANALITLMTIYENGQGVTQDTKKQKQKLF